MFRKEQFGKDGSECSRRGGMNYMMTLQQFDDLHDLVDRVFKEATLGGLGWKKLALRAGLAHSTVCRLGSYVTMYPRAQTVLLLARAVGLRLRLEYSGADGRASKKTG